MPSWLKKTLQISGLVAGVVGSAAIVLSTGPITLPLVLKAIAAAAGALTVGGAGWTAQAPGSGTGTVDGGSKEK